MKYIIKKGNKYSIVDGERTLNDALNGGDPLGFLDFSQKEGEYASDEIAPIISNYLVELQTARRDIDKEIGVCNRILEGIKD